MNSDDIYNSSAAIPGGYYLKPRLQPEIRNAPPHVREIYDHLVGHANHKDRESSGRMIMRGQCVVTYEDIQETLAWYIGYRKKKYEKYQIEAALKWLRNHKMIATAKTTRGMIITIENYDFYQNPKNYENYNEHQKKTTGEPQTDRTINKELEELKEELYITTPGLPTRYPDFFFKDIENLKLEERYEAIKKLKKYYVEGCKRIGIERPATRSSDGFNIARKLIKYGMNYSHAFNVVDFVLDVYGGSWNKLLISCFTVEYIADYRDEWARVKHLTGHRQHVVEEVTERWLWTNRLWMGKCIARILMNVQRRTRTKILVT